MVRRSGGALLVGLIVMALQLFSQTQVATAPPKAASSATGIDLAGKAVSPLQLANGKAIVLIFVRSDCPISNRYAPTIKAFSHQYRAKALFVLVYPDKTETAANISKHLRDYGYDLTAMRDPQHQLVKLAQAEITPEVAVFSSQGDLLYHGRIDNWYEDFGRARPAPTTHELQDALTAAFNGGGSIAAQPAVGCYISDLQ